VDDGSYTIRDIGQLKMMAHPYRLKIMHDLISFMHINQVEHALGGNRLQNAFPVEIELWGMT